MRVHRSRADEVPWGDGAGRIVACLDPRTRIREGQEAELWLDASKVHLFEAEGGTCLTPT